MVTEEPPHGEKRGPDEEGIAQSPQAAKRMRVEEQPALPTAGDLSTEQGSKGGESTVAAASDSGTKAASIPDVATEEPGSAAVSEQPPSEKAPEAAQDRGASEDPSAAAASSVAVPMELSSASAVADGSASRDTGAIAEVKVDTSTLKVLVPQNGEEIKGGAGSRYNVGDKVQWRPVAAAAEDEWRSCEIVSIDTRDVPVGATGEDPFRYYIHFVDMNRRLDRWVLPRDLRKPPPPPSGNGRTGAGQALGAVGAQSPGAQGSGTAASPKPGSAPKRRMTTRREKRKMEDDNPMDDDHHSQGAQWNPALRELEKKHMETTKVKNVDHIYLGKHRCDCWYYSPYPEKATRHKKLYVCEFCLTYMSKHKTLLEHRRSGQCTLRHPPGNEIYRKGRISVFEVDGAKNKVYCQCLCLLSRLFLDHKTLYYDVAPFMFYLLCECDDEGFHVVGYFSKEKCSAINNNLACILTLPPFQRRGYGRFLIELSYELSRRENKIGSPEKPLSDLGKLSYRSFWTHVLLGQIEKEKRPLSIKEISQLTFIKEEDVIGTLKSLNMITYWKGENLITATPKSIEDLQKKLKRKSPKLQLDTKNLKYIVTANRKP